MTKYRCPHCGKVIEEVNVVELTWKRFVVCAGMGIGCSLIIYPLVSGSRLVAAIGAFIVSSIVMFLLTKSMRKAERKDEGDPPDSGVSDL